MNIDTDLQWAFAEGIRKYFDANAGYLQNQIGNPDGADSPNKNSMTHAYGCARVKNLSILDLRKLLRILIM